MPDNEVPKKVLIVIFGGTGDLVRVKLATAIRSLFERNVISKDSVILGVANEEFSNKQYHEFWVNAQTSQHSEPPTKEFLDRVHFQKVDFCEKSWHKTLKNRIDELSSGSDFEHRMFYYAVWSEWYASIAKGLSKGGLIPEKGQKPSHVVGVRTSHYLEKPVGNDLKSAQKCIKGILEYVNKDDLYLIDHYIAKEAVRDLLVFRHGNRTASPALTNEHIDRVTIYAYESVGVEDRGKSYDDVGVLRDMWIPHLLQLLAVFCCNPPRNEEDFPKMKREVLESIANVSPEEIENHVILGQYSYGIGDERSPNDSVDIRPYRQENGVPHTSQTSTFCAIKLMFDEKQSKKNDLSHWNGVPFYLITGKRMHRKETGVWIRFKPAPGLTSLFDAEPENDLCELWNIRFHPYPAIIRYHVVKAPGNYNHLGIGRSRYTYSKNYPDEPLRDYETLLKEAIGGQNFWFVKANTILESWRIGQPFVNHLNQDSQKIHRYTSGDPGPLEEFGKKFGFLYLEQLGLID